MVAITNGGTYVLTVGAAAASAFLVGLVADRLLTRTPLRGRVYGIATAGETVLCATAAALGYAHDFAVERQLPLVVSVLFATLHAAGASVRRASSGWAKAASMLLAVNVFGAFWAIVAWVI